MKKEQCLEIARQRLIKNLETCRIAPVRTLDDAIELIDCAHRSDQEWMRTKGCCYEDSINRVLAIDESKWN